MGKAAEFESHRYRILHLVESVQKLLHNIEEDFKKINFDITLDNIDLFYIKTTLEQYASNLSKLSKTYKRTKLKPVKDTITVLEEQKELLHLVLGKLEGGIQIAKKSHVVVQGGLIFNQNADSIVNKWKLIMAYNDRIVKEIKNTPNLPFLDEKDRQTLIFDKEIRHYLDTIATLIHEEGNRLLLKSHHLQRTVERKWRLLQEDVNKLIDVLDDQLKLVRKKKKDKRLMSKLRKLQKEEKELLKQTIKEDELLATFMSHDVKQYLQDINAFEKEVKKAEKELR